MGTVRNNPPWTYMYNSRVPYMLLTEKVVLSYFHIINRKKKTGKMYICKVGSNSIRFDGIFFQYFDLIISYS